MKASVLIATIASLAALLLVAASTPVVAQNDVDAKVLLEKVYEGIKNLADNLKELRAVVCPKQPSPQLCESEFGTATMIVTKIGIGIGNLRIAAVTGDRPGLEKAAEEVKRDIVRFNAKLEELVKKYRVK